ncbi:M56 family metallopeptidase [Kribbella sp. DT2]|uniref:M56 family metallopeptidase n=1 Tax=Kribbella sp. DT2 TaxID=3393427 RepID=UPI003CF0E7BA
MTTYFAALLLGYAVTTGVVADRLLARAAWTARHPAAALWVWHACAGGFLLAIAAASVVAAHDLWERAIVWIFHADKPQVHLAYAGKNEVGPWWNVTLVVVLAVYVGLAAIAARQAYRNHLTRSKHRRIADLLTTQSRYDDVQVLQTATPAAYCLPGRRRTARIIITIGAVDMLTATELEATIEHERAHLHFGHHRMILWADAVTALLRPTGVLKNYADQVRRLSEMAADDRAAVRCGPRLVASALLAMCTIDPSPSTGSGQLAMSGSRPAERIRRLLHTTPAELERTSSILVIGTTLAISQIPLALLLVPAFSLAGTAH